MAKCVQVLLDLFVVVPVTRAVLQRALHTGWSDFEDAVKLECAEDCGADFILTRDQKFIERCPMAISPRQFLDKIQASGDHEPTE